jgi:hypothetical protein
VQDRVKMHVRFWQQSCSSNRRFARIEFVGPTCSRVAGAVAPRQSYEITQRSCPQTMGETMNARTRSAET